MQEKQFLVLKITQIKKWYKDNNMLSKPLDQQEKGMLDNKANALII